jgi:DNA-binding transcriptional LysR family regulator
LDECRRHCHIPEILLFDPTHFNNYAHRPSRVAGSQGETAAQEVTVRRRYLPSLERLRALHEVARTGGFSAAGQALALTQPAISNQIRQLEQLLGVILLERAGKTARPTREGEVLIAAAARAFAELETAMDDIARMRAEVAGTLVLAAGATATTHLLPPVLADLRVRHPAIEVRVLTGNTTDLMPGLLDGAIDLGVLTDAIDDPRLARRHFFRDRLVCITPPGESPPTPVVASRDLAGRQLMLYERAGSIRHAIDAWLGPTDRHCSRITDLGSAAAQVAFVRAGLGWSIISEIAVREEAAARHLEVVALDPPLFRDLVLAWRSDRAARPVLAAALDVFGTHAASPAPGQSGERRKGG